MGKVLIKTELLLLISIQSPLHMMKYIHNSFTIKDIDGKNI